MDREKASARVTVNPAFLQELKADNRRLHELLDSLRPLAALPLSAANHPRHVRDLLAELLDQLAIHFSLEEAYGYFEDAVNVSPRLAQQAETLRAEHATLYVELRNLVDRAEQHRDDPDGWMQRITVGFERFDQHLRQHETAEEELIQQAFGEDIGVGD